MVIQSWYSLGQCWRLWCSPVLDCAIFVQFRKAPSISLNDFIQGYCMVHLLNQRSLWRVYFTIVSTEWELPIYQIILLNKANTISLHNCTNWWLLVAIHVHFQLRYSYPFICMIYVILDVSKKGGNCPLIPVGDIWQVKMLTATVSISTWTREAAIKPILPPQLHEW